MNYDTEDAIVVTPPTEVETEQDNSVNPVAGPRGTANATVGTEPTPSREFTYTREDIKAFAREELSEAIDKGEFDDVVQANPELSGNEADLNGLKVGNQKYKIPSGTNVVANPTLAGTESELTGIEVGSTKYKVPQPTNVVANPTLAGTESDLEGLQVGENKYAVPPRVSANPTLDGTEAALSGLQIGNTKYKAGGGAQKYLHTMTFYNSSKNAKIRVHLVNEIATPYTSETAAVTALRDAGASTFLVNSQFEIESAPFYSNGALTIFGTNRADGTFNSLSVAWQAGQASYIILKNCYVSRTEILLSDGSTSSANISNATINFNFSTDNVTPL